jgi:hypothetical protein
MMELLISRTAEISIVDVAAGGGFSGAGIAVALMAIVLVADEPLFS